jgi:hypothetical protein
LRAGRIATEKPFALYSSGFTNDVAPVRLGAASPSMSKMADFLEGEAAPSRFVQDAIFRQAAT